MRKQRGFTLIEVLISGAILTALIALSTLTFSYFSSQYSKVSQQTAQGMFQAKNVLRLSKAMEAVLDYYVKDQVLDNRLVFALSENRLYGVTAAPISGSGETSLFELSVVATDDAPFQLQYREWSLLGRNLYQLSQVPRLLQSESDYVLLMQTSAQKPKFEVLSARSMNNYAGIDVANIQADAYHTRLFWFEAIDAAETRILPIRLRIWLAQENEAYQSMVFSMPYFNHSKFSFLSAG